MWVKVLGKWVKVLGKWVKVLGTEFTSWGGPEIFRGQVILYPRYGGPRYFYHPSGGGGMAGFFRNTQVHFSKKVSKITFFALEGFRAFHFSS